MCVHVDFPVVIFSLPEMVNKLEYISSWGNREPAQTLIPAFVEVLYILFCTTSYIAKYTWEWDLTFRWEWEWKWDGIGTKNLFPHISVEWSSRQTARRHAMGVALSQVVWYIRRYESVWPKAGYPFVLCFAQCCRCKPVALVVQKPLCNHR